MATKIPRLKRKLHSIPTFVYETMVKAKVLDAYEARPPYQRNDYIGWITSAKRDETKQKRLKIMIAELKKGDVYMNMRWKLS